MSTVIDTHVHLYPVHDAATLLGCLAANLSASAPPDADLAAVLVDGARCDGFGRLASLETTGAGPFRIRPGAEPEALEVSAGDGARPLRIIAGRQIVTAERLEVLALGTRAGIADGMDAERTIDAVLAAGARPVLAWAPGKWFGARGRRVAALIGRYGGPTLLLGDTSLRAVGWPTPRLMRRGMAAGLGRVCGSDPLPEPGEERRAGMYATRLATRLDPAAPARSLHAALGQRAHGGFAPLLPAGRRSGPAGMLVRLIRHAMS